MKLAVGPLDRKLLRDLWRLKWQVLAIALLIACGVSVTVMAYSAQKALTAAQARYYSDSRFADVFASAKRAPRHLVRELAAIPGVAAVDVRAQQAGLMEVPGLRRPATARVIALPDNERAALNQLVLARGRMPDPARADEAVALKTFLEAAHVDLGDRLSTTIGGRRFSFKVVGAVLTPEYVYVPSPESSMPDDAHQGVFWAPRRAVEQVAGMGGAFNTVALKLRSDASEPAVLAAVDRILAPYGGTPAYGREDQVSNAFLEAEFDELSTSASIIPPIFLLVAAALVHLVLGRMVDVEREQIGLLKAFGYRDLEAAGSYLRLAAAIGLLGAAGGGLLGAWFGAAITDLYAEYMRFPVLEPSFSWAAFAAATAASVCAALLGSLLAVRRAVRLSPAVAMQPPRPPDYRRGVLDRIGLERFLDQPTRIIVRSLERFPVRAVLTAVGLASSLSLLVGAQFLFSSLEKALEHTYYRSQRWSEAVGFGEVRDARAVAEVRRLPGVYAAEPVRMAPARITANGRVEKVAVTGLETGALMSRPLDSQDRPVPYMGRGVILSRALAAKLGVAPGDQIRLEVTEGRRPAAVLPVTGLAEDFSGLQVHMARSALNRMLGEGDRASGAQLLVAPDLRTDFYRGVDRTPMIVAASSRDDTMANWRMVMAEAFQVSITFYIGFAAAIAFGVAFNTGRIQLAERSRDLATLHVLGFGHGECAYILLGELGLLALVGIPLGFIGGDLFVKLLLSAYERDELRLPSNVSGATYGVALGAYLTAVGLAALVVGRRIWNLDLVAVLKTRE